MTSSNDRLRLGIASLLSLLAHCTALAILVPVAALLQLGRALVDRENDTLRIAVLLALLLHLALVVPAVHWLLSYRPAEEPSRFRVDLWNRESQGATADEEEKTPEEEIEDYEPREELPEGQVVEAPPAPDRRRPKKPRYLAERDSRVEQETQAGTRSRGAASAPSSPEAESSGKDAREAPGGMTAERMGVAPLPSELERAERGEAAAERRAPPALEDISLEPSMSAMAGALAGTGLDNLDDVIRADRTALNTAGWDYASFFNRVKRSVERYWHPDLEWKKRDPYGNIYGLKDRTTVLLVVLRGDGSLKNLYVMNPCGAPFLDDEAYEAVRQASPFPNVPAGLRDRRDGLVKFSFHFIVEVGSRPVFRMRRYR